MKPISLKAVVTAAAAGLMLTSVQAQAGSPPRTDLLAGAVNGHGGYENRDHRGHHQSSGHRHTDYAQHRYDNARRYAANAVRQAHEAHRLGYYRNHPRWSADFHRHFNWAMKADPWKLERETRKRALELRELRRDARRGYGYPH